MTAAAAASAKRRTAGLLTAAQWGHAFQYALTFPAQSQLLNELVGGNFGLQARVTSLLLSFAFGGALLINPVSAVRGSAPPCQCTVAVDLPAPGGVDANTMWFVRTVCCLHRPWLVGVAQFSAALSDARGRKLLLFLPPIADLFQRLALLPTMSMSDSLEHCPAATVILRSCATMV